MMRPRTCRSTGSAPRLGTTSRRTSAACRTSWRPSSRIRSARSRPATRSTASPAARWAPTTRSPSARTSRVAAPSTPASARPRRRSTPTCRSTSRAPSPGPRVRATRTTATAARPCCKNYQQVKVPQQPNLNEPIGFDQLPDGRIIQTDRRGGVRLHNPATGTTQIIANLGAGPLPQTLRVYTNSEDGLYGPAVDNELRHQQVGVPVLLAADGHRRQAVGRRDRHADHAEHDGARTSRLADGVGPVRRATSSSRASSSSRTPTAPRWT